MNWKVWLKQAVLAIGLMLAGYWGTTWLMTRNNAIPVPAGQQLEAALASLARNAPTGHDSPYQIGQALQGTTTATNKATTTNGTFDANYEEWQWEALIPPGWDPTAAFKGLDLANLKDNDPKAQAALGAMRKAWDSAPVNVSVNGQKARLPGFAIPLEQTHEGVSELLLVPYFGACIHTPPPPANQIIHVRLPKPRPDVAMMQPYWVWGELKVERHQNNMGDAAYRMQASGLASYSF